MSLLTSEFQDAVDALLEQANLLNPLTPASSPQTKEAQERIKEKLQKILDRVDNPGALATTSPTEIPAVPSVSSEDKFQSRCQPKMPLTNMSELAKPAVKPLDPPTYKPLPDGWKDSPHYWFYGWAVTDDILRNYLLKVDPANVSRNPSVVVDGIAFHYLKRQSGYRHMGFVGGKPDKESYSQGRVIQTKVGPQLDVVAISCTRSKRLFNRRPTKEQLAKLVEILGEEPRWFEDVAEKKNFNMGLIDPR